MEKNMNGSRFVWVPRIIAIAFILFLMLFTFDVFSLSGGVLEKIGGFLIHALPAILLAAFLALFWNRLLVCGWFFIGAAVFFTFFFNTYTGAVNFLVITFPLLLTGLLFLISRRLSLPKMKTSDEHKG